MTEKTRTLKVVEHDDARWLAYECDGKPEQCRIDQIVGVLSQGKGSSLQLGRDCDGRSSIRLCDSTSAEVLAVLGWGVVCGDRLTP